MDYKKIYDSLIDKARHRKLQGYKEVHHIVPRCCGGTNDKSNLVSLTAREHFIAHLLLPKIYKDPLLITKLRFAIIKMSGDERDLTSKRYERLRRQACNTRYRSVSERLEKNFPDRKYCNCLPVVPDLLKTGKLKYPQRDCPVYRKIFEIVHKKDVRKVRTNREKIRTSVPDKTWALINSLINHIVIAHHKNYQGLMIVSSGNDARCKSYRNLLSKLQGSGLLNILKTPAPTTPDLFMFSKELKDLLNTYDSCPSKKSLECYSLELCGLGIERFSGKRVVREKLLEVFVETGVVFIVRCFEHDNLLRIFDPNRLLWHSIESPFQHKMNLPMSRMDMCTLVDSLHTHYMQCS